MKKQNQTIDTNTATRKNSNEPQRSPREYRYIPDHDDPVIPSWLVSLAIFGDSTIALLVAFVVFVIAVVLQQQQQVETIRTTTQPKSDFDDATILTATGAAAVAGHVNHDRHTTSHTKTTSVSSSTHLWNEFASYESLGRLPEDIRQQQKQPPKIYHISLSDSDNKISGSNNNKGSECDHADGDDATVVDVTAITPEMIQEYHRDGVIGIRGLISNKLLDRIRDETKSLVRTKKTKKKKEQGNESVLPTTSNNKNYHQQQQTHRGTQFHTVTHSTLFRRPVDSDERIISNTDPTSNNSNTIRTPQQHPTALMEVALWSNVSMVAAALLQLSSSSTNHETLRVIRDIFLAKDDDPYVCGWHVDDFGFWPALPQQQPQLSSSLLSLPSREGINAWIALDDMIITEETGGFALAIQSHTAKWNYTAYNITGAPTTQNFPTDRGYHNVSHMFQERIGYGTCNMERTAPHIHRRLEEMKRIYPVRRGDVIFHTRYLFHRTIPITSTAQKDEETNDSTRIYRRYSIRYGIGSTTIIPPGYGTELSVLYDPQNGGLSADAICTKDSVPWYPQAYPHIQRNGTSSAAAVTTIEYDKFWQQYTNMIHHHIPIAEQRLAVRKQEMRPYLKKLAKEQHRVSTMGQFY